MKKILILITSSLLLLAGCSDAYTSVSNKTEAIVKIGNTSITKGDLYTNLLANYGSYYVLSDAMEKIIEAEIETTDAMITEAEETINQYKTTYGESWENVITMYGFADEEELKQNIINSAKVKELTKKYVSENFDTLVSTYNPKKAVILTFSDVDAANAALVELKNGIDPAEVGTAYGSTTSGEPQIVTTASEYTSEVKTIVNTASVNDDFAMIPSTDGTSTYIIKVLETDANNFKEEVIDLITTYSEVSDESDKYYFHKYGFKLYDKALYDDFNANYSGYLAE